MQDAKPQYFLGKPKKIPSLNPHKNRLIYTYIIQNKTGFIYRPLKTTIFRDFRAQAWHSAESKRNNQNADRTDWLPCPTNWPSSDSFHLLVPFVSPFKGMRVVKTCKTSMLFGETQKDIRA